MATVALVLSLVALFNMAATDDDHDGRSTPRCQAVAAEGGDFVPTGQRPCTLYGSGQGAAATGTTVAQPPSGRSSTSEPGTTAKRPAAPMAKAPGAKAPSVKQPAPRAPAAPPKVPGAPPRVTR
ncbi:hypothetical protein ABZV67_38955 [Streptomyces sp. NPDC005065]|uniref:hypothetical protein n=1 Tax=Streptomyces sp. NPDC005065 TaxID=3154461 RepID=UPI00339E146C